MSKYYIKRLVIVLISSVLISCAGTVEPSDESVYESKSTRRDCISQSSIRDYQVLDDSNLIVTASVKRKYHLVLSRRAFGLRSSWKIGFRSSTGMLCGNSSELVFDEGFGTDSIRIASIRELGPEELDELLIRFGKKEPEIEQTPATQEVEGAEVEELD
jgi:hypothetical protein